MAPKRSLSTLVVTLFAIVAALVAVVFAVQLVELVRLRDDTQSSRRATDVLAASYGAELSVLDIETGLRGYLLTRKAPFLEPYRAAVSAIGPELHNLADLASGSAQRQRVTALRAAIAGYINGFAQPLAATRGALSDSRIAAVTADGKRLVDGLRRRFAAIDAAQLTARSSRRTTLNNQTSITVGVAAAGLAVTLLLLVALGVYIVRSVLSPIRAVAAALSRRGHGDLTARVPEVGRGEVALLERSFNEMAEVLERRTTELSDANVQLEQAAKLAQDASRMKSEFLANMSHEIRTPLNGVVGMVTLLAGTPLSSEQREYVDMARASSQTLLNVVSDILDVSKIEAGRLELEQQDFDLHDLVSATRAMLSQEAAAKGLELTVAVTGDVPRLVRGDGLRVGQVLGNLLSNAVKFTPQGKVALRVSVAEQTNVATVVSFEVRDTGIGIPVDRLAALFDPFTQADESTTREFGGTGLGLTISRDLAKLMGGTITAHSEVGKGSVFELSIPFAPPLGDLPLPVPAMELRGLRVLVVDDSPANRRILEAYVSSWGMRPTSSPDSAHALAELASAADDGEPFDVALLDMNMPGESGIELAQRITDSPKLRTTRLILLSSTGTSIAELNSEAVKQRLTKPVSQSSLLDAIAVAMHAELEPQLATESAPGSASAPSGISRPTQGRPTAPARILVAEDNYVNRLFIERLLTRLGHTVTTAADGRQALRRYETGSYDAIIMDCQMPEFDGYDTTRVIRRREAALGRARTPIVAMTAAASDEIRQRCLDAGMDGYLTKPLSGDEVAAALAAWLPPQAGQGEGLAPERIDGLRSVFPGDELAPMLVRIAGEVTDKLALLEWSVAAGDYEAAASAAHSIRGSAQMVGARETSDATIAVEDAVREEPPSAERIAAAVAQLREAWGHTRNALEAHVEADRREYHPSETTD